jgi:hypothetical protein
LSHTHVQASIRRPQELKANGQLWPRHRMPFTIGTIPIISKYDCWRQKRKATIYRIMFYPSLYLAIGHVSAQRWSGHVSASSPIYDKVCSKSNAVYLITWCPQRRRR